MRIYNFRRTEALDLIYIEKIIENDRIFSNSKYNLINLHERGLFSLTAVGAAGEIVGCLILNDTPPVSLVQGVNSGDWLKTTFKFEHLNAINTLFIQLIVIQDEYKKRGFVQIIRAAFRSLPDVNHLILLVPENTNYDDFDETLSQNILRMKFKDFISPDIKPIYSKLVPTDHEEEQCDLKWDVVHFMRRDFDSALQCRLARTKDNDDVMPILKAKSEVLEKIYGEFYVSELIEAQDDTMKSVVLVSNKTGIAVGFMSAVTNFDGESLNKYYELAPFNYFQKRDSLEVTETKEVESLVKLQADFLQDFATASENTYEETDGSYQSGKGRSLRAFREDVDPGSAEQSRTQSTDDLRSTILSDAFSVDRDTRLDFVSTGSWTRRHLRGYLDLSLPRAPQATIYDKGKNNALVIQLYVLLPEHDCRAKDFLPFLFDQFPGIDYAVISVPRLDPETALLQEFYRVKPKINSLSTQELYVYHRANLVCDFTVRPALRSDLPTLLALSVQMHNFDRRLFCGDLKKYITLSCETDGTPLYCYIAETLGQTVGVLFARAEQHIDWLRANYSLDDYVYFMQHGKHEFATIVHFLLSSSLHSKSKLFIREVMRQSGITCFFYYIYPPFAMDTPLKLNTPLSCLSEFYAVRPRRQIVYPTELAKSKKGPQDCIIECPLDRPPPAVYHITRNLLLEPKIVINARIIVVGASSTSLAFLERLTFESQMRFSNLVLLSPHGIPGDTEASENHRVPLFYPARYMQDRWRMGQISLHTLVNVVLGKLTAIDRYRKQITVNGDHKISYDFLILAPGAQYHPPTPISISSKVADEKPRKNPCEEVITTTDHKASNLFLLNDEYSTASAIEYVEKKLIPDSSDQRQAHRREELQTENLLENPNVERRPRFRPEDGPIIIYGDCLYAYACVNGLLRMGVPSIRILMLHPFDKDMGNDVAEQDDVKVRPRCHSLVSPFDDFAVESVVNNELEQLGVRVFKRCTMVHWNDDPNALWVDEIESANVIVEGLEKRIRCVAFFSFVEKRIDQDFRKAVNDACLVFDKNLVIDVDFHTSDPCIRAAGPATKYRRIYYNDRFTHALCNSYEVGEKLAEAFLREFDPCVEKKIAPAKDELHLLPKFKMPCVINATLPGGYTYLRIWEPGYKKNYLLRMQDPDFGRSLVTGSPNDESGYFHIHVNDINRISRIVCLSKNPIPIANYMNLYSTHEKAANNLIARYDEGLITDFYAFFQEPWAMALFHDRFDELKKEIHDLGCKPKEASEPLIDFIRSFRDPCEKEMSTDTFERLHLEHLIKGHKYEIEKKVINFVASNYDLLPMYAKPDMAKQVP